VFAASTLPMTIRITRVIRRPQTGVSPTMQAAVAMVGVEEMRLAVDIRPGRTLARGRMSKLSMDKKAQPPAAEQASDLVVAIAERQDREAFAALFKFFAGRIKSWVMRAGAPAEIAEEIAQETLLTVWRKASLYDPARATASAWVFTIARNVRIDRLRKDMRARQHLQYELIEQDQEEPERPDGLLDAAQREERVRTALESLPEEQVLIVRLSFFDGRPHSEIAEHLGIPLGTVKSRLRLAMGRLRQRLGDLI
jgi:RNA polymerase sigma-70 factor, ECF subfamily